MKISTPAKVASPQAGDGWLLKPLDRPDYTDTLAYPDDITKLSSKDLSCLFGRYTALYAYVVSECAKVNQQVLRIDSEIFVRKNNVARTAATYGRNKYAADAEIRLDKKHEELNVLRMKVFERKEIIERFTDIYDKYSSSLSREMTRRASEIKK